MPQKSAGTLASEPLALPKIRMPRRPAGTLYRGREGMWSWVLHRITGVAIYFFLLVHILDTALVRVSPEAYNAVINTYKTPIMGLGEIALVAFGRSPDLTRVVIQGDAADVDAFNSSPKGI